MRILTPLVTAMLLSACASMGGGEPQIPADAVGASHTEDNGDVVTQYRVAGQLRMVKIVPFRGPTYYLYDRNGDGKIDPADGDAPVTYYKLFSF